MSTPTPPGGAGGPAEPGQPQDVAKPIEKFKADKEQPEKLKPEKEHKLEIKEHKLEGKEKIEKNEIKEHKLEIKEKEHKLEVKEKVEKLEKEKHDGKEFKAEFEKQAKHEKEIKVEFEKNPKHEKELEKPIVEKGGKEIAEGDPATHAGDPAAGLDPATLLAHADALVAAGQQLRHFIEQSQRPDLSGGALKNEADLQGNPEGSG